MTIVDSEILERTTPSQRRDSLKTSLPLGAFESYPGAAIIVGRDGAAMACGPNETYLSAALRNDPCWTDIEDGAARAIAECRSSVKTILPASIEEAIQATFMPLENAEQALVLLHPTGFPNALQRSLMDSRQRYKDLIEAISDFCWETDTETRFSFVSTGGALDWMPEEMVGQPVANFLTDDDDIAMIPAVFSTRDSLRRSNVWFRRADGSVECLDVVAVPIFDNDGNWLGTRGLCRTVTEQQHQERESAESRLRAQMTAHLAHTMQREINPERAVAEAMPAVGLASCATGAAAYRIDTELGLVEIAHWGEQPAAGVASHVLDPLAAGTMSDVVDSDFHFIGMPTHFQGNANGAIVLWRESEAGLFTLDERGVLDQAASPFGAAIAQFVSYQATLQQSRTDALTGLPNRRAFREEATRRLQRLERSSTGACVMFVDCDNFKLVNDVRGHREGDNALVDICRLLQDSSRPGDIVARLGGDEFVLWVDGIDEESAGERARTILEKSGSLSHYSGNPERPFGVSLGLALLDTMRPESLDQLLARADAAMYAAKQGRSGYAIAGQNAGGDS